MSKEDEYKDIDVEEAMKRALKWKEKGATIFFKFTCEKCGSRQTFDTPNTLFEKGSCEECGHITEIKKCGFAVMMVIE